MEKIKEFTALSGMQQKTNTSLENVVTGGVVDFPETGNKILDNLAFKIQGASHESIYRANPKQAKNAEKKVIYYLIAYGIVNSALGIGSAIKTAYNLPKIADFQYMNDL